MRGDRGGKRKPYKSPYIHPQAPALPVDHVTDTNYRTVANRQGFYPIGQAPVHSVPPDEVSHQTPDFQPGKIAKAVVGKSLYNLVTTGHTSDPWGAAAEAGMMFGPLKFGKAGLEAGRAAVAGENVAKAAVKGYKARPIVEAADRLGQKYVTRKLVHKGLEVQLPKQQGLARPLSWAADKASKQLQKSRLVTSLPGVRVVTAAERVVKAAGRQQRVEAPRQIARMWNELHAIGQVKQGSPEDVANFWYAQLPKSHRNAEGLRLVKDKQAEELKYIASGRALEDLAGWERSVKAQMAAEPDVSKRLSFLRTLEEIKVLRTDLPQRQADVAASIGRLNELAANAPKADEAAIAAVHALSNDRARVLVEHGRLDPRRVGPRKGLVAKWVGLEPKTPPQDIYFNQYGDTFHFPNESLNYAKTAVHNIHDGHGNVIGSMVYDARPGQSKVYVESVFIRPEFRSLANFKRLVQPLLGESRPIEAVIQNPRLRSLFERTVGKRIKAGRQLSAADFPQILRGDRPPSLPEIVKPAPLLTGVDGPAYIGHRLPPTENFPTSFLPVGGTGRVPSPAGVGSENKLVLAKTGRVRASIHVAAEDWHAAQTFEQAARARDELGKLGDPFTGHIPKGYVLVNPKARTIPAAWRRDEFAALSDSYDDIDKIRQMAEQVKQTFIGENTAEFDAIKQQALADGVSWDELRIVPKRLVDRYYNQFRDRTGRTVYGKVFDSAVDAISLSIVFARVGYVPKNFVQNAIMAAPHQGPMLLVNAVKAGQVAADGQLRHLIEAEVGHTGATGALERESFRKYAGKVTGAVSHLADDPARFTAFIHEAANAGVIRKYSLYMNERDRSRLVSLLTDAKNRPLLNDIRSKSVESMADFTRLTPGQSRMMRRVLIIPGWLMAGSRYPFHFALNHPVRSALVAYIAMGEPHAPDGLRFNQSIDHYMTSGGPSYLQGVKVGDKVLRTGSLSPVNTPWDLGKAAVQTGRGKKNPFDKTETIFDYASPLGSSAVRIAQGDGVVPALERLAPNEKLVRGLIHPRASSSYPEDSSRLGRLKREVGVVPIKVGKTKSKKRRRSGGSPYLLGPSDSAGGSPYLKSPGSP